MLHTIGQDASETTIEPRLEKYIFPGGVIPSIAQVGEAMAAFGLSSTPTTSAPTTTRRLSHRTTTSEPNGPPRPPEDIRLLRMWRY